MSGSQHLTLLNNVNVTGAGAAQQWNGGPAMLMAWWDGGAFAAGVHLEVSPDGGTHWAQMQTTSPDLISTFVLNTNNNGHAAWTALNLPPCTIRAVVDGGVNPTNMNVVLIGYDDALKVQNAS